MGFKLVGDDFYDFVSSWGETFIETEANGMKFATPRGDIHFKEHVLRDRLSILEANYAMTDDVTISGKGETSLLELQFNLSESDILYYNKPNAPLVTPGRSGNITYLPADENQATIFFKKDLSYDMLDVHLPVDAINQYAGESKSMDIFVENIQRGVNCKLTSEKVEISPAMFHTIMEIKNCRFEGLSRRIYLESKVYELIALLFERIDNNPETILLNIGDEERIREAAFHICENIKSPLTIIELARTVGINQTKLKTGFKQIFGDTVFGYMQKIRMREAKGYLLDTQLPIHEIALNAGYRNASNFSIAFKRVYGYSPMALRGNAVGK